MANERSALNRGVKAGWLVARTRWYLLLPLAILIPLELGAPYHMATKASKDARNNIATVLLLASVVCTPLFWTLVTWATYTESRYGEAMRRTSLTQRQLSHLLDSVPFGVKQRWQVRDQMLSQWSAQEFLGLYKENRLLHARRELSAATVVCSVYATNAANRNKDFDPEAFMSKARQKYLGEKRCIEKLTTIPN